MLRALMLAAVCLIATAACAPAASPTATPTKAAATTPTATAVQPSAVKIAIASFAFSPTSVQAPVGGALQIIVTNNDLTTHTFTAADLAVDKELAPGASVTVEVKSLKEGRYTFMCKIHPSMKGEIVVGNPPAAMAPTGGTASPSYDY